FRQSSFRPITRVPQSTVPNAWTRPLVSWHALVPFTFRIQVSHQTQEPPFEFLPADPGIRQCASWRTGIARSCRWSGATAVQSQRARGGILQGLSEEDQVDLAVQAVVVPAVPMADLVLVPQCIPYHVYKRRDSDLDPRPCVVTHPILLVSRREPGVRGRPSGTGGRRR